MADKQNCAPLLLRVRMLFLFVQVPEWKYGTESKQTVTKRGMQLPAFFKCIYLVYCIYILSKETWAELAVGGQWIFLRQFSDAWVGLIWSPCALVQPYRWFTGSICSNRWVSSLTLASLFIKYLECHSCRCMLESGCAIGKPYSPKRTAFHQSVFL